MVGFGWRFILGMIVGAVIVKESEEFDRLYREIRDRLLSRMPRERM